MNTVPTLCATATAVGVSAVGLSLGRPTSNSDSSTKRSLLPANVLVDSTMISARHPKSYSSPLQPSPLPSPAHDLRSRSRDGRPQHRIRRMTTSNTTPETQSSVSRGVPPLDDGSSSDVDHPSALRTRPSWIKRLSNLSSQGSSHEFDSRPASPSVSCSNKSMAFSHAGSTAPIMGNSAPPPLPPNKLVKRSTSVRTFNPSVRPSSSRRPTLRRPATSHQRSATLQYQSSLPDHDVEEGFLRDITPPLIEGDSDVLYTQFFSARVSKGHSTRRSNNPNEVKAIRRIYPDAEHRPTLVLAKSVVACAVELDDNSSQDGDSVYMNSRPGTPSGLPVQDLNHQRGVPANTISKPQEESSNSAKPRRSFSITDYISSVPQSRKGRSPKVAGSKLLRKSTKRTSSAPPSSIIGDEGRRPETETSRTRRDITDPTLSRRVISSVPLRNLSATLDRPAPPAGETSKGNVTDGTPRSSQASRPPRLSTAASEQASTLIGSDHDFRELGSGDEDDLDFQSDTLFDSLRTRTTRSTSGARGPRIDTIFQDLYPLTKSNMQTYRDVLPKNGTRSPPLDSFAHADITEEDECTPSPGRTTTVTDKIDVSSVGSRGGSKPLVSSSINSSPPSHPKPLSLGTLEWDALAEEEENRWSFSDEEHDRISQSELVIRTVLAASPSPKPSTPCNAITSHSQVTTPQQSFLDHPDRDTRSSIFDWSEQRPADKSPGNRTPPRPSTVHGKKDTDGRGSRSMGRRAPSALHARSQSVPVVPDAAGKRDTVVTNKFGTWGVGSKGVTEDWNDDFDFDAPGESFTVEQEDDDVRVDSGFSMFVPKSIREQQSNVLANIGLLREWGLLIEELKELRIRASALGLLRDHNKSTWQEVDAMIELADQEADEAPVGGDQSPSSSHGFELDGFDEMNGLTKGAMRTPRKTSLTRPEELSLSTPVLSSQQARSRRKSILNANRDLFQPNLTPPPSRFQHNSQNGSPAFTPPALPKTRPRKDSEAVALSVIEALRNSKNTLEPISTSRPASLSKKVPFDTATLKHIVPYVNGLMRRVKAELRATEGLYSSPSHSPATKTSPCKHLTNGSPTGSPASRKKRQAKGLDPSFQTNDGDIAAQMKMMTVM